MSNTIQSNKTIASQKASSATKKRMKFYGLEGIFNRKLVMLGASSGKS